MARTGPYRAMPAWPSLLLLLATVFVASVSASPVGAATGCGRVSAPYLAEALATTTQGLLLHQSIDERLVAVDATGQPDSTYGPDGGRDLDLGGSVGRRAQVGDRLFFLVTDAGGEQRLVVTDLGGTPDPAFGSSGAYVVGPYDHRGGLRGWTALPDGRLVLAVDAAPDEYEGTSDLQLVILDAAGQELDRVQVPPQVTSTRDVLGLTASGTDHVYLWVGGWSTSDGIYRVPLGGEEATEQLFVGAGAPSVQAIADRPGAGLLVVGTTTDGSGHDLIRAFAPDGALDASFGDGGELSLETDLAQIAFAVDQGEHLLVGGSGGRVSAVAVGDAGLVSGLGAGGRFGSPGLADDATGGRVLQTGGLILVADGPSFGDRDLIVFSPDGSIRSDCAPVGDVVAVRLAGGDRYETAAAVVAAHFAAAGTAVVATGADFPDALAGGAGAAALQAPVLLTRPDALPAPTLEQLTRLQPGRILVLGGPAAISSRVQDHLSALPWGPQVERLAGSDRYDTAVQLSRALFAPGVTDVYVATGRSFPDALAAVPVAAQGDGPILLVPGDHVPPAVGAEIERLAPTGSVVVVGGPAAVRYEVDSQLRSYHGSVDRTEGKDRYLTAAAVSEAIEAATGPAFVASGQGFADALAAGPAAARLGVPLLLTHADRLVEVTRNDLARRGTRTVYLVGGEAVLAPAVASAVNQTELGHAIYAYVDELATTPRTWHACRAIDWAWYRGDSPAEHLTFLEEGLERVTAQTGVRFVYRGETTVEPASDAFADDGPHRYPVVMGFMDLDPLLAGLAGPEVDPQDRSRYRGGSVALSNSPAMTGQLDHGGSFAGFVMLHEVGHLLGLDHVGSPTQLMTHVALGEDDDGPNYRAGDLRGFARTLDFTGC